MGFEVAAEAYERYMGRFARPLGAALLAGLELRPGQRVLDVGCGPGTLIGPLVDRLGVAAVSAVDPSVSFVATVRSGWPELDIHAASAEQLPFADASFDATIAQLVVHFMTDPVAGLREMARVTRPGGIVTASVWDAAGGAGPLDPFWRAVGELDPDAPGERELPGARAGHLAELATEAGLHVVVQDRITVRASYEGFDEWWRTFELGVGVGGTYLAGLDDGQRSALRARCAETVPAGPFQQPAAAWVVTAHA